MVVLLFRNVAFASVLVLLSSLSSSQAHLVATELGHLRLFAR